MPIITLKNRHYESDPHSHLIISSIRVYQGPGHDVLHIWNRGGKAGTLTVTLGDGMILAMKLIGPDPIRES